MKIKTISVVSFFIFWVMASSVGFAQDDWAKFQKYQYDNSELMKDRSKASPDIVFMGNSITEGWAKEDPSFFTDHNFVGRGISGQTTYQMLVRFREDVVNLHPEYVLINGGTNDVAENNHVYNEERTMGNIISMCELAEANGIKPILSSVLPAAQFHWRKSVTDVPEKIQSLNAKIKRYADSKGYKYVDYYPALSTDRGALNPSYTRDGVHPTLKGYKEMEKVLLETLNN